MCVWCRDFEDAHCWKCDVSLSAPNRWCDSTAHLDGGESYRNYLVSVRTGHIPTTYIDAGGDPVLVAELLAVQKWNRDVLHPHPSRMEPDVSDEPVELDEVVSA